MIFSASLEASRIADLIYRKYESEIHPPRRQIIRKNANGEDEAISLPGMTRVFALPLKEPANRLLLENFENDPIAVFTNRYLRVFVIFHVAKDYENDPISREMFSRCLEFGLGLEYVHSILIIAVKTNSVSLIERIISEYGTNSLDYCQTYSYHEPESFVEAMIKNGRFELLKRLFLEGKILENPGVLAVAVCNMSPPTFTEEAIDFLDVLIVRLGVFDLNEPIMSRYQGLLYDPLLHTLLSRHISGPGVKIMVERIAAYLISVGADPEVKCRENRSAYEKAELKGYILPVKLLEEEFI